MKQHEPLRPPRPIAACLALLVASGALAEDTARPAGLHAAWDALLQKHVSRGAVDYAALKQDVSRLDAYLDTLGAARPSTFTPDGQLAFWINAYNAFTVKLILNHYPVESIRRIDRPWKQKTWLAGGKMFSLDEIEHTILRGKFKDPRIHFAIVCASIGCPDLHNRALTAQSVQQDLADLTRRFLNSPKHLRIQEKKRLFGRKEKILHLSRIFEWFHADFTDGGKQTVVDFAAQYVDKPTRDFLLSGGRDVKIRYLEYDWGLNRR